MPRRCGTGGDLQCTDETNQAENPANQSTSGQNNVLKSGKAVFFIVRHSVPLDFVDLKFVHDVLHFFQIHIELPQ